MVIVKEFDDDEITNTVLDTLAIGVPGNGIALVGKNGLALIKLEKHR